MGSSGSKRKGRKHLPKVGTRLANEQEIHDRRERAMHPFAEDPWHRRTGSKIVAAIVACGVAIGVVIGVVALIFAT